MVTKTKAGSQIGVYVVDVAAALIIIDMVVRLGTPAILSFAWCRSTQIPQITTSSYTRNSWPWDLAIIIF
jgi:hypothetical protein